MVDTTWKHEFIEDNKFRREFDAKGLYEWHQDDMDREITIESLTGNWQFQFDDTQPMWLSVGMKFKIKSDQWHRLIPPFEGKLTIVIDES